MARRSVLLDLMPLLEAYLDDRVARWSDQPDGARKPTLPETADGKVNVRGLVEEMRLPASYAQHFFNKPELARAVNLIASEQGLKGIGSRVLDDAEDEAARARIARIKTDAKREQESHAVARIQVAKLSARVHDLEGEVARLKARLDHARTTGMVPRTTPVSE